MLRQLFSDVYAHKRKAAKKRANRLAALRNSKRSRVRKKWRKYQEPDAMTRADFSYCETAPRMEMWTRGKPVPTSGQWE